MSYLGVVVVKRVDVLGSEVCDELLQVVPVQTAAGESAQSPCHGDCGADLSAAHVLGLPEA